MHHRGDGVGCDGAQWGVWGASWAMRLSWGENLDTIQKNKKTKKTCVTRSMSWFKIILLLLTIIARKETNPSVLETLASGFGAIAFDIAVPEGLGTGL